MSLPDLAQVDLGLVAFLALGAGAMMIIAFQCMQMCRTLCSDEDDKVGSAADSAPAPPLPRSSSSREKASKSDGVMKFAQQRAVAPDDIEAGSKVTFKANRAAHKPKASAKLAAGERPLRTPLMPNEGCASP